MDANREKYMDSTFNEGKTAEEQRVAEQRGDDQPILKNERKKKSYGVFSFIFSVILIPLIMTVVLSAYEEETNAWVHRLLEGEKKETYIESVKRLAAQGNLPEYKCGPIGTTFTEVTNRCGVATSREQSFKVNGSSAELSYLYGETKLVMLTFQNEMLQRIDVKDLEKESTPLKEIKRVFGKPAETNEKSDAASESTFYTYHFAPYKLTFWFNRENGKLENFTLETTQPFQFTGRLRNEFETKAHPLDKKKRINSKGGVAAAKQVKRWIDKGDLGNYDCGPLGTSYRQVKVGRCRIYQRNLQSWSINDQTQEKGLTYQFKDRTIHLKFFKESLTSISIDETQKPLHITKKDIEQVFGKPARDKSDPNDLLGIAGIFAEYKLHDKEVTFYFNDKGYLYSIWLRKSGLYDPEIGAGALLPQTK
jgi:hypothetical protein